MGPLPALEADVDLIVAADVAVGVERVEVHRLGAEGSRDARPVAGAVLADGVRRTAPFRRGRRAAVASVPPAEVREAAGTSVRFDGGRGRYAVGACS